MFNMTTRMQKHKKELCFLSRCSKDQRYNLLNTAPSSLVHAVGDCAKSVLEGDLPISNYYRKKLRKDINILKKLATRNKSITSKKKIIKSQRGSSLLAVLWKVLKGLF